MDTNEIYKLRDTFSIIGLTGRTGSGCTDFANIISKKINFESSNIKRPDRIKNKTLQDSVFKRKYTICYKFLEKHNNEYENISYGHVLIFYSIHYGVMNGDIKTGDELINFIKELVTKNFKKAEDKDEDYEDATITRNEVEKLSDKYDILFTLFHAIKQGFNEISEKQDLGDLYKCFFNDTFKSFANNLFKLFDKKDYYLGSLFYHRLGNNIRATGKPIASKNELDQASADHIYSVVYLINKLVKAWRVKNSDQHCHICIDSLRNSLEIMFLKERYSAFYMIAIYNGEKYKAQIEKRIQETESSNKNDHPIMVSKIVTLAEIENGGESFKDGLFFAPDVENCIQKSDIHVNNPGTNPGEFDKEIRRSTFYTMEEQWIKIKSLMLHPGIITPSPEERCMQIAYNAKFNSGCISRQVGAVITDENQSIRSIGWNDVPQGSISCNLRSVEDIVNNKDDGKSYSPFEIDIEEHHYEGNESFSSNTKKFFTKKTIQTVKDQGLNYSFCFKSLHNRYEGKDNQVHTRSLHAEENAMLQISKFGGPPLKNGTLYSTASPCELCAKKAYQLGLKIIYIDPYPGISMKHVLKNGYNQPSTKMFTGIIGRAYNKLFEPILSYKDELKLLSTPQIDKLEN